MKSLLLSMALVLLSPVLLSCKKKSVPADSTEVVANLAEMKREVSARKAKSLVWNPAEIQMGFSNYDAIRTGNDSSGVVAFRDRSKVSVSEKSLVIILEKETYDEIETEVLALPSGTIEGELATDPQRPRGIEVRTKRAWVRVDSREQKTGKASVKFRVSMNPKGSLKVESRTAQLDILTETEKKTLKPNEVVITREWSKGEVDTVSLRSEEYEALPRMTQEAWTPKPKSDLLLIESPESGKMKTKQSSWVVKGRVNGRFEVFLNGEEVSLDASGRFSKKVNLNVGLNIFTFQLVNAQTGEVQHKTLEITRSPQ